MGVQSDGMEYWKPKCHLIWKSESMGPVENRTYFVGFTQKTITKRISFYEHYTCTVKKKGKIKFHEDPRLHEYQSEGAALHDYLAQNPHEEVEAKKQHEETTVTMSLGGSLGDESSDDVDEPTTPREDGTIKSNTPLGGLSAGELTNYRSKYQTEDFQFGMSFSEPEPEPKKEEVEIEDYENRDIQPADEDSTINYTDSSITDMLF